MLGVHYYEQRFYASTEFTIYHMCNLLHKFIRTVVIISLSFYMTIYKRCCKWVQHLYLRVHSIYVFVLNEI